MVAISCSGVSEEIPKKVPASCKESRLSPDKIVQLRQKHTIHVLNSCIVYEKKGPRLLLPIFRAEENKKRIHRKCRRSFQNEERESSSDKSPQNLNKDRVKAVFLCCQVTTVPKTYCTWPLLWVNAEMKKEREDGKEYHGGREVKKKKLLSQC